MAESTAAVKKLRTQYKKEAPHRNSISKWMKKFKETGSVSEKPRSGRPRVSEKTVASVEETWEVNPRKSLRRVSLSSFALYRFYHIYRMRQYFEIIGRNVEKDSTSEKSCI